METIRDLQKKRSQLNREIVRLDGQIYLELFREIKEWNKNFLNKRWQRVDYDSITYFFKNLKSEKSAIIATVNANYIIVRKEFYDLLSPEQIKMFKKELADKYPLPHDFMIQTTYILW